jgi:DNA polymerase V
MEGARIFDGDILVVDRSITPKAGSIVVAAVFGELVVKRVKRINGTVELISEHPQYKPIQLTGADDVFVWGVVTGTVRPFNSLHSA